MGFQDSGVTVLVDWEIKRLEEQPGGKINSDQRREVPEGKGGFLPELSHKVKEDACYRWRHGPEKGRLGTRGRCQNKDKRNVFLKDEKTSKVMPHSEIAGLMA